MKWSRLAWPLWGFLLLGQIILDAVAFPRYISRLGATSPVIANELLFIDVAGIACWIAAWFIDRNVKNHSWRTYTMIIVMIIVSLFAARIQLYAWS